MAKHARTFLDAAQLAVGSAAAAVAVASGALVLGLPRLGPRIGIGRFVGANRAFMGWCFLISATALLIVQVLPWALPLATSRLMARAALRRGKKHLRRLTRSEKNILNQYVSRRARTLVLDSRSNATVALQNAGVIKRAADTEDPWTGLPFTITPWAWNYVRTHGELLHHPDSSLSRLSDWRAAPRA